VRFRWLLLIAMSGALFAGCGVPSPRAGGSGYGPGIPREAVAFGQPPQTKGDRLNFKHPGVEDTRSYRAKHPPRFSGRYEVGQRHHREYGR
jgi:hypothetical protein